MMNVNDVRRNVLLVREWEEIQQCTSICSRLVCCSDLSFEVRLFLVLIWMKAAAWFPFPFLYVLSFFPRVTWVRRCVYLRK